MRGRSGTPSCVWRVDPALIERLDACLGPPLDAYVRGWQVWLEPHGPDGATLEWRLHPPAGFRMPRGINHNDLFDLVLQGLADSDDPAADPLPLGKARLRLADIWEVLEAFPAFGDDIPPDELALICTRALDGRAPDAAGRADHARLGDRWKGSRGAFSVGAALLETLEPYEPA